MCKKPSIFCKNIVYNLFCQKYQGICFFNEKKCATFKLPLKKNIAKIHEVRQLM